jgi:hypothetical protein
MTTVNPATQPRDELNQFTWNVRHLLRHSNDYGRKHYSVRLRNGSLVQPEYKAAEDATCEDAFYAEGYRYCWNLDGTSVTSREYDMMEIVTNQDET